MYRQKRLYKILGNRLKHSMMTGRILCSIWPCSTSCIYRERKLAEEILGLELQIKKMQPQHPECSDCT